MLVQLRDDLGNGVAAGPARRASGKCSLMEACARERCPISSGDRNPQRKDGAPIAGDGEIWIGIRVGVFSTVRDAQSPQSSERFPLIGVLLTQNPHLEYFSK